MKKKILLLLLFLGSIVFASSKSSYDFEITQQNKVEYLIKISNEETKYNFDERKGFALSAIEISEKIKENDLIILAYANLAGLYEKENQIGEAAKCFNYIIQFSEKQELKILYLERKAELEFNNGSFTSADSTLSKLEKIYSDKNDKTNLALTLIQRSRIFQENVNYELALLYLQRVKDIAKEINSIDLELNAILKSGRVYHLQNEAELGEDKFLEALQIASEFDKPVSVVYAYNGLIISEYAKKNYNRSLEYYSEALKIKLPKGEERLRISLNNNISLIYEALGQFEKARNIYLTNFEIADRINEKIIAVISLTNLSENYLKNNQIKNSKKYLDYLISYSQNIESPHIQQYILKLSSEYYKKVGKYKKAYMLFDQYCALKDSTLEKQKQNYISELQTKYETEKKETENALLKTNNEIKELEIEEQTKLRNSFIAISILGLLLAIVIYRQYKIKVKSNQEILLQKKELEVSNATKDKFFSIISHDLRSPFNSLLGLTELLSKDYDDFSEEETRSFLTDLNKTAVRLYKLLENLLNWSRIQTGRISFDPSCISANSNIDNIIILFEDSLHSKNLIINNLCETQTDIYADEQMFNVILRNLISNAIKFSNEGGIINILLEEEGTNAIISVEDCGVGMSEEDKERIFRIDCHHTTPGTKNERGTGLGLILAKEMIEKHNGFIKVESEINKGTKFTFSIPLCESENN